MEHLLHSADDSRIETLAPVIVLGLNHEQQYQELMLTDIKHPYWIRTEIVRCSTPVRPKLAQPPPGLS